jgi:hypothetical protein
MNHARTRRWTAGAVATTLLGGLLTLLMVAPAQANHGSLKLEVYREYSSAEVGSVITLTARLMASNGTPPTSGGTDVEIDWEIESGPATATRQTGDPELTNGRDGAPNTPEAPDHECTTPAVVAPGSYPECIVRFTASSSGESLVRAWIDHDGENESNEQGGTEADLTEGRLSSQLTDCATEFPGASPGADDGTFADCGPEGSATPGRDGERDETDVVTLNFFDPDRPLRLACADFTLARPGEDAEVQCIISDDQGRRRPGYPIDAKHMTGANDPNSNDSTVDYEDGGEESSASGLFTVVVDGSKGQTGFAEICAWIDTDDGTIGDDLDVSYDTAGAEEDGGECDTEVLANSDSTNMTDRFQVRWQVPAATTLDVTPDSSTGVVGSAHVLTAKVVDQFGDEWTEPTDVLFEWLEGSIQDTDRSTPGIADRKCTTPGDGANPGTCSLGAYSSSSPGTDTICAWFGSTPSATCNGEKQNTDTDAKVDVVTRTWTAAATTTTTQQTAEDVAKTQGYTLVGADGGIFNYGTSTFHGSTGGMTLNKPVIGMANKKGSTGYWLVASDGGIFTFGDAEFFGSMGDKKLNAPILGMEATPSGKGYWLFAADGGIFTFGDATFQGSTGNMTLNAPVVGMAVTEKGDGYWLVARDGGIFTFNAPFHGSTGSMKLNEPVFDMGATPGDKGYWLVARDGGIFSFGDAENKFYGSAVGATSNQVIGLGVTPTGAGYWIADNRGAVFPFGDARFLGDRRQETNNATTVGFATVPKK